MTGKYYIKANRKSTVISKKNNRIASLYEVNY